MRIIAVDFARGEARKIVKQKLGCTVATWSFIMLTFALGMAAAMAANAVGHFNATVITLVCCACVSACVLIGLCVLGIFRTIKVHDMTRKAIAEAIYTDEEIMIGGNDVEFEVDFSDEIIKFYRKGYTRQVTFDLTGIKKVTPVYSSFGEDLLEFIREYYFENHRRPEFKNVKVTDFVTNDTTVITIAEDGKPVGNASSGYYLKKGLLK